MFCLLFTILLLLLYSEHILLNKLLNIKQNIQFFSDSEMFNSDYVLVFTNVLRKLDKNRLLSPTYAIILQ